MPTERVRKSELYIQTQPDSRAADARFPEENVDQRRKARPETPKGTPQKTADDQSVALRVEIFRASGSQGLRMKRQGLPKTQRLRKGPEFSRTLQEGSRLDGEFILAYWIVSPDSSWNRVGFAAGRKLGGSVQRNRMKRLLREAYRKRRGESCRGLWIVLMASRRALNRSASEIEEDVARILVQIEAASRRAIESSPSASKHIVDGSRPS